MTLTASLLLDIVLAGLLLYGFLMGVRRGFILTLCSLLALLVGLVGGWYLAVYHAGILEPYLLPLFTERTLSADAAGLTARVLLFLVGFVGVQLLWNLVCHVLHLVAKLPGLHFLNKVLGGLLGFAKNTLLLLVALWVLCDLLAWIPADVASESWVISLLHTIPIPSFTVVIG